VRQVRAHQPRPHQVRPAQVGVPQDPQQRLDQGLAAAVKAVNALKGSSVTGSLIDPVLVAIKVRYGFATLAARERAGDWWVEGTINPTKASKTDKKAGPAGASGAAGSSNTNPIEIRWVKPAASAYPAIVLAPPADVAARRTGSGRLTLVQLNSIPTKFTAYPTRGRSLGGVSIGVTNAMSKTRNGFVFQAATQVSDNTQKDAFNSLIEKWGYNRDDNAAPPTDGDHVMEKQLGGPDAFDNVWPLNSGINRSSGSTVRGEITRIKQDNNLSSLNGVWLKLKF